MVEFLNAQTNAVVYVCDNSDGREAARYRKFQHWFNYYPEAEHQLIKVTSTFHVGEMAVHCAMLIHHKNKRKKEFSDAFFEFTEDADK